MNPQPGAPLPERTFGPVHAADIAIVAALIGDPNPLHFDRATTAAAGLGDRLVNQGPAGMSYVAAMLEAHFGPGTVRDVRLRFSAVVREGDRLVAGGTIASVAGADVQCDVWLQIEGGERVLSGTARVVTTTEGTSR